MEKEIEIGPLLFEDNSIRVSNQAPIVKCLECGYLDFSTGQFKLSEEAIPLCPQCYSVQLQIQN